MKVLKSQQDLCSVKLRSFLIESSLLCYNLAQVTTRAEVQNQEKLGLRLKRIVEIDNERVLRVRKNISLSLGVSY